MALEVSHPFWNLQVLRLEHSPVIEGDDVGFGGDTCHGESEGEKKLVQHIHDWEGHWGGYRRTSRL